MNNFVVNDSFISFVGEKPTNDIEAKALALEAWNLKLTYAQREIVIQPVLFDNDTSICGFCMLYFDRQKATCNVGCPIYLRTGRPLCENTPYAEYTSVRFDLSHDDQDFTFGDFAAIIQEEITFLESLDVE